MPRTDRNHTQPDPLLVKPAEACRLLGCSDTYLRHLTREGFVEVRYVGKHRRVVLKSLHDYVKGLPQDPAA